MILFGGMTHMQARVFVFGILGTGALELFIFCLTKKYRIGNVQEEDREDEEEEEDTNTINVRENSFKTNSITKTPSEAFNKYITAREIVLKKCQQTQPLPFEECYPDSILNNCHKIGEGVYGEVFLYKKRSGESTVIKIIPIENDLIVNGERQKTFEEVLSEITISLELSQLRNELNNQTTSFVEVQQINCVIGRYPLKLIDLWHLYDEIKQSENDTPEIFQDNQLYIVLELANAGQDAESFVFNNALQALSMFKQVACALAVAENQLKFEHRDLHWGNILIKKIDTRTKINYQLNGHNISINSYGIEVTIIDYTLSRAEFDGVVVFNDLSQDEELFQGIGDYQFEVYRLMQQANRNNWQNFHPQSNLFWLHYVLKKMIDGLRYSSTKTKTHSNNLKTIKDLEEEILNYCSVVDFVEKKIIKKSIKND